MVSSSNKKRLPNPSDKPFRVLSIDGGGVRGLIPLTILAEIERLTGKHTSELFDLIVGNSTGGIVSLCMVASDSQGKPRYTAAQARQMYLQGTPKIFQKSFFHSFATGGGLWSPKYNRANLDNVLAQFFGDSTLNQATCPVVVTSYNLTKDTPSLWSSYRAKKDPNSNIYMKDAAGATSAAPTYFAPKTIHLPNGKITNEVDGGIYVNDPEVLAVAEAMAQNPKLQPEQIFVLSLGTGQPKLKPQSQKLRDKGIIGWLMQVNLIDLMINAETQIGDVEVDAFSLLYRYRIQLNLAAQNSAMDNVRSENLQALIRMTESYIQKSSTELNQIGTFLTENRF